MEAISAERPAADETLLLADRVLARLPGPRLAWMLLWGALMPLVVAFVPAIGVDDPSEGIQISLIFFTATLGGFVIARALARAAAGLRAAVVRLNGGELSDRDDPFRSIRSPGGPVILSLIATLGYAVLPVAESPSLAGVASLPVVVVAGIPMYTLAWVCGSILVGVDRLGRRPLHLRSYEEDRSLGLRQFGRLAFLAFLPIATISAAWIFNGGTPKVEDLLVSGGIIFGMMALLLLSLYRLHRQMVAAKIRYLRGVRAQIVAILDAATASSPEQLPVIASRLQLAESRERRAQNIQEWPFDEGIQRSLIAIASSVVITILGRLVLHQLGL